MTRLRSRETSPADGAPAFYRLASEGNAEAVEVTLNHFLTATERTCDILPSPPVILVKMFCNWFSLRAPTAHAPACGVLSSQDQNPFSPALVSLVEELLHQRFCHFAGPCATRTMVRSIPSTN